jgi:hypothetical protein
LLTRSGANGFVVPGHGGKCKEYNPCLSTRFVAGSLSDWIPDQVRDDE